MPAFPACLKQILVICCMHCWLRGIATNGWNETDLGKEWLGPRSGSTFLVEKSNSDEQCSLQITFRLKFYIEFKRECYVNNEL